MKNLKGANLTALRDLITPFEKLVSSAVSLR